MSINIPLFLISFYFFMLTNINFSMHWTVIIYVKIYISVQYIYQVLQQLFEVTNSVLNNPVFSWMAEIKVNKPMIKILKTLLTQKTGAT